MSSPYKKFSGPDLRYPHEPTRYTKSMRDKEYNQQFQETWTVVTDGGVEFEVPLDARYIVLRKNEEPTIVNAKSLDMVMYLYPNAHTVYPITEMKRVSQAAQIIDFDRIREKLDASFSSRNADENRRKKESGR